MEYINFGRAGLKVSRLALGLGLRGQADEASAQRMIERALELGINFIDCANIYGPMDDRRNIGISETILGRAIRGRRDQVVISSKVAGQVGPGPNDGGASRVHILREVERSLARLDTDYIDVYLVHRFDETTPLEETLQALDELVRSGKVRYIGCCNYAAWQVCRALWLAERWHAIPFMTVQNPYNLLSREVEVELFPTVREFGLGFMAYSPLAVGLMSGMYVPGQPAPAGSFWAGAQRAPQTYAALMDGQAGRVVGVLLEIAQEVARSPAQVALSWVLDHPEVTCAITGSDTVEQLEDNFGALGWKLDPAHRRRLDEASQPAKIWDGA